MAEEKKAREIRSFICFNLAGSTFGVDIISVLEVDELREITHMPKMPEFLEGLVDLRGKIVPVIDLRKMLSMEKIKYGPLTRIIVIDAENGRLGIIVDKMAKSMKLSNDEIEHTPNLKFLKGVGKSDEGLFIILDIQKILAGKEMERLSDFIALGSVKDAEEKKEHEEVMEELQLVTFSMGNEWYAVEIGSVQEVLKKLPITNVPHAPDFVSGVINIRGKITSVVDLKRFWRSPSRLDKTAERIVVMNAGGATAGLLADSVSKSVSIPLNKIDETLLTIQDERREYIKGETKLDDGRLLVILESEKIMASEKMRFL